jgi:adenylate cyclase
VFEQVRNKLALGFDYLGPTSVKNIAADVPIYRVLLELDAAGPPETDRTAPPVEPPTSKRGTRQHVSL